MVERTENKKGKPKHQGNGLPSVASIIDDSGLRNEQVS